MKKGKEKMVGYRRASGMAGRGGRMVSNRPNRAESWAITHERTGDGSHVRIRVFICIPRIFGSWIMDGGGRDSEPYDHLASMFRPELEYMEWWLFVSSGIQGWCI
ncbi:hypothetical protein PCASD_01619 [Puccinia coronata f. sp. avenae]|uniref:Uncharacterized protein n=2 Tax=Puccinia coronata f. sp. avenae TaxID=200324 RepID=A0A2N5T9J8_9BASI|nr:hypothetical protein PCASD_12265 [Puccinia coronata f. sp. avenae]PLW49837.1 hypothetical protein PCASD_01619 [Puccinia coronata f. sp. avenae]